MRMEGQKWTSFCPDQGCMYAEGAKDIQELNSGGSSNDNIASDFMQ